jgi:hypothetical protein
VAGLNWYRNSDGIWELMPFLSRTTRRQPALLIAGAYDPVITINREAFEAMDQQDRPAQVNQLRLEFLGGR